MIIGEQVVLCICRDAHMHPHKGEPWKHVLGRSPEKAMPHAGTHGTMVQWTQDAGLACAGSSTPAALMVQQALCSRRAALSSMAVVHQPSTNVSEALELLSPGGRRWHLTCCPNFLIGLLSGFFRAKTDYFCQLSLSAQADVPCWLECCFSHSSQSCRVCQPFVVPGSQRYCCHKGSLTTVVIGTGLLLSAAQPRASPSNIHRKRMAFDDPTSLDEPQRMSPASGRRRLRSSQDVADVFADVTILANNAFNAHESDSGSLAASFADERRAGQNFEAALRAQLALGDVV